MAMEWRELGIENWINTLTKSHYLFVLVGNRIWRERVLNLSILLELVVSQNFLGEFYEHLKLSLSCSLQVHTPSGTSLAPEGALLAEISLSRLINILSSYWVLRASPEVLSIWPWTLKLDEENSKHAGPFAEAGKRHSKSVHMAEKSANKYEPNAVPCFWLANHNDGPGGLLLVVPHLFAVPVLVLWVGL
jgi:hypothetical protein